ncbi:tetratricopeptide repeat protein [Actinacidiphila paucisporea]|uniref:Tetratricopeptide repeat-containing protein n=1 Tax=Actinacidiphila paucisporea TaxID=310782 RepID=A0A1M7FUR1_9ACTN|nr:tetratricopeptide repeat protein [Actinacidiphila paucisporea]SHM07680.1 Tetratricopeptide repeat-containing protein [Actinacidiphila paucisporea]
MAAHRRIVGDSRATRSAAATADGSAPLVARCHQRLRGPYTGVDTVLAAVLPRARRQWPDLVERHRVEILYGMPELQDLIGPAPRTLASESPFEQRTRFFGSGMIRCMSQGVVTFLLEYAGRLRHLGEPAPYLFFDEAHRAEPTTREFLALLVRRADPELLLVAVGEADAADADDELADVLASRTVTLVAAGGQPAATGGRTEAELAAAYVEADGTSDDPAQESAYRAAAERDPDGVRRLHDARAAELAPGAGPRTLLGAVAHHRERGTDPGGAGRRALREALTFAVNVGFSAQVVDLGRRGRAVTDPVHEWRDYWEFTQQAAAACIPIGRLQESLDLYHDLLERYTDPKVHMMTSYAIAMLHTRFLTPRDHDLALRWQNNAVAIAGVLPDPGERRTFTVFHRNGLALIEMHRRNLGRALELIESGIAWLDAELDPTQWQLHRSQLLYNRARLLAATGRGDEAFRDYSTLVDLDPYYTDYLSERARVLRDSGDLEGALADYDRAVDLAPPFPELFYNRGTARADAGDAAGALADFGYVLDMEPDDLDTLLARAELLLAEGDIEAAERDIATGLRARPGEPRLVCMQGTAELQRGRYADAVSHFDAALAADPGYPAALINRAVAHFQQDRPSAALDDLTAALALVGDDPDLLLNRGIAHQAQGDTALALADFDRALQLPGADLDELRHQRDLCAASSG